MTEKPSKKENRFKREGQHKKKSVPDSWRKPNGKHSNARLKKKHAAKMPNPGYRTKKDVRGLHPSGYEDVLVHNPSDLDELDNETEAARIASKVGGRKKEQILEKAEDQGIKVLNPGDQQ
jgi:large subunit ribosomal protein L32e